MAIGWPFLGQSWSAAEALPAAPPATEGRVEFEPGSPTEGVLDLGLVRAVIEDGLLMVFGPDGDPIPPEIFRAAAAEQPDAGVQLRDGPQVAAERIAAVLDAQIRGPLGSGQDGADHPWIEAMLGIGPQPAPADAKDLLAEDCALQVVAFGKELLITSPTGEAFLIAQARSSHPESICLRLANGGAIAVKDLVARLLAGPGAHRSESAFGNRDEFAARDCRAWLEGDELVIDLPTVGRVHLAPGAAAVGTGAPASLFMSSGETATLEDLAGALGQPSAPSAAMEYSQFSMPATPPPTRSVPLSLALPDAGAAGAEDVALLLVRGLPEATSLSAGARSGDGSWLLSPRDLVGLSLILPVSLTADFPLEIVAIRVANRDGELTSASSTVTVPVRSDALDVAPAPIPLGLAPGALGDSGPFDAIIVLGVPVGGSLTPATYDREIDAWVLLPRQLAELSVLPASGQDQDFTLSLFGVCLQPGSGEGPRLLAEVPVTVR